MCALSPILPRVPPLAVPCLGTPPGVSPLLEDADGVLSLALLLPHGPNPACGCTGATFGQPCAPRLCFCAATMRRQEAAPTLLPLSLADLITHLRQPAHAPLPDAGPVAPPPPCLPRLTARGEDPRTSHVQTARDRDPSTLMFLLVWSLFGWVFVSEEAEAPVAVLPTALGYCLCVSCAMDRWLP